MAAHLLFKQKDSTKKYQFNYSQVFGICRKNSINLPILQSMHKLAKGRLYLHFGDVTDALFMYNLIKKAKPDEIYNLAA